MRKRILNTARRDEFDGIAGSFYQWENISEWQLNDSRVLLSNRVPCIYPDSNYVLNRHMCGGYDRGCHIAF